MMDEQMYGSRDACPWYQTCDLDETEWAARAAESNGASTMQLHEIPASLVARVAADAIALYQEYRDFGAEPEEAAAKAVAEVVEGVGTDPATARPGRGIPAPASLDSADWPY